MLEPPWGEAVEVWRRKRKIPRRRFYFSTSELAYSLDRSVYFTVNSTLGDRLVRKIMGLALVLIYERQPNSDIKPKCQVLSLHRRRGRYHYD